MLEKYNRLIRRQVFFMQCLRILPIRNSVQSQYVSVVCRHCMFFAMITFEKDETLPTEAMSKKSKNSTCIFYYLWDFHRALRKQISALNIYGDIWFFLTLSYIFFRCRDIFFSLFFIIHQCVIIVRMRTADGNAWWRKCLLVTYDSSIAWLVTSCG